MAMLPMHLNKFVDAEQWDAEDIAGRLGMILHTAFLFAGFQPYGARPRSGHLLKMQSRKRGGPLWLSRLYTAPDLAHRERADAAVLILCVHGRDVAVAMFLTAGDGVNVPAAENRYLERLDLGIETLWSVALRLSWCLGFVDPWVSRMCWSIAHGFCWGLLDDLCRRNGLPLSGFASLPNDLKVAVLEKLTDGRDLARVECVCTQLRLLVAERDHELWKALYNKAVSNSACQRQDYWWRPWWFLPIDDKSFDEETTHLSVDVVSSSWKDKYVEAMWGPRRNKLFRPLWWHLDSHRIIRRPRHPSLWPLGYWIWMLENPPSEEEEVSMRVQPRGGRHRKLSRNDCKKWHGGGAIHSPSSQYRWKHR